MLHNNSYKKHHIDSIVCPVHLFAIGGDVAILVGYKAICSDTSYEETEPRVRGNGIDCCSCPAQILAH